MSDRTDSDRLDWIESHPKVSIRQYDPPVAMIEEWTKDKWNVYPVFKGNSFDPRGVSGPTIRETIDLAIEFEKTKREKL